MPASRKHGCCTVSMNLTYQAIQSPLNVQRMAITANWSIAPYCRLVIMLKSLRLAEQVKNSSSMASIIRKHPGPRITVKKQALGVWKFPRRLDAETDVFLNVMQVMDAVDGPQPLATESIVSNEMAGVKIEDWAVLFSKSGVDITNTASFELPVTNEDVRVLVTELSTGLLDSN